MHTFQVTGIKHDTGARMVLDLEAECRASAERAAVQSGMEVTHIVQLDEDAHAERAAALRAAHRGQPVDDGSRARLIVGLVVVVLLAALVWFVIWPRISALMAG